MVRVLGGGAPAEKGGGGAGDGSVGGLSSRLASGMMQDDTPSRYTRNWRLERPMWAPSPVWDEWLWHN